jgi:hypothetical protein
MSTWRLHTALVAAVLLAAAALPAVAATPGTAAGSRPQPPVGHIFVLLLENQSYSQTFGARSRTPYLAVTLPAQGALLTHYYGTGHSSLDNYITLISGQAPNRETQLDCRMYSDFKLLQATLDEHGQALGSGCVYPRIVKTLPDQLEPAHLGWKGYMEDMGRDPQREPATCAHPPLGSKDPLLVATKRDKYATKHNPFVYFHTIIDDPARCDAHVVSLDVLQGDLATLETTPAYSFITPNLCNDGHDASCIDGSPGGVPAIDAFLRRWVPLITAAPAFRKDGLLIITFDESDGTGAEGIAACCGEQPLRGSPLPAGFTGPGGGRIGAVLLSPFIRSGTISDVPYNHYSLLRTVEDIFGLAHLGYAAEPGLTSFGRDVFTAAW